jgi:cytochrome c oxidase cbb3-type subunit 3
MTQYSPDDDKKHETGHVYDGIKEYNYPAPTWWQVIFFGSIVWALGYLCYFYLYDGETLRHRLDRQLVEIDRQRLKEGSLGPSNDELMTLVGDSAVLKVGHETFLSKCSSCHGEHGQGIIGPNLTDNFWLHGKGQAVDIFVTVDKGVPDKGMPPWGAILAPAELKAVVAYVKSIQGSHPDNPKAPQGEEVKP